MLAYEDMVTTADGLCLGKIAYATSRYNRRISLEMRHIEVDGNNGATYYGRYAPDKGNAVMLKRCADAYHPAYRRKKRKEPPCTNEPT